MTNELARWRIWGTATREADGDWCFVDDVENLEDERDALKKRIEELTPLARFGKVAAEILARCKAGWLSEGQALVGIAIHATHHGLIENGELTGAAKVEV
jgi:hypothetical protein